MIEITRAGVSLDEALRLQLQAFSEADRSARIEQFRESEQRGVVSLHNCLVCRRGSRIVGVLLLVSQSDGTMYVWPAATLGGLFPQDDLEIRRALYREAISVVDAPGIWIGQSLLETHQDEQSQELAQHGFPRLTDLDFMHCSVPALPEDAVSADAPQTELWESEPFDEAANGAEFATLVEQTYENTRDCPELNGTRDGWESLESHRQAGEYSPERWRLFRYEGQPAGLLLLAQHPPEAVWEVVYFGIAPRFRGMGFGQRVLEAGIDLAQKNGIREIVLAVDVRNSPAMRLYKELNFTQFDRRIVHARLRARRDHAG